MLTWLKMLPPHCTSHHECWMFMILPRKSNLVLLTDTGAGLVGAEELNSLVGVSCCHETQKWAVFLLYLAWSLINKLFKVREIPDQKDRLWHHQKRTHFFLCPSLCPVVLWGILADSSAQHACLRLFLWQQSPSGSSRLLAPPPPHRLGRFWKTVLSVFLSDFRSHHPQILLYQRGEELEQEEGGRETDELVLLWKWE